MKNKKALLAAILMASVAATNILTPANVVSAEEKTDMVISAMSEEQKEKSVAVADGVELTDLPAEDGAYVVYMETDITDEVSIGDEVQEIAVEAPEVIVETDLTAVQARELQILSSQSDEIYIEENIFLEGASSNGSELDLAEEDEDNSFIKEMESCNWKKEQIKQGMSGKEETEWNVQMVHADEVAEEISGESVKVAILDSGVEFLAGIPVERSINLVKDEQELPYYMNDMTGHGTAIADIIHQICPKAEIYSVKVMDSKNRGRLSDIVAGIYWCIEQDVDIINMSFGTSTKSDILEKAIEAAAQQDIMMVSSAGNGGTGSAVEYPAAFAEVIAVGAVDTTAQKTQESATGEEVELVAPGEQIAVKSMLGLETVSSGTSMAAPHVTGAAALLIQQSNSKDAMFIRKVLQKSSNPLGNETYYGNGLLDVEYAVELLQNYEELGMAQELQNVESEILPDISDSGVWANEIHTDTSGGKSNESSDIEGRNVELTPGEMDDVSCATSTDGVETKADIETKQLQQSADGLIGGDQAHRPVETFEDLDYVEGRWELDDHKFAVLDEAVKDGDFTSVEMNILKEGAAYQDHKASGITGYTHPEWHGNKDSNYLANYRFATKIAKNAGDTSAIAKAKGQSTSCYNKMKGVVSTSGINGVTWQSIFSKYCDLSYSKQDNETKKHWRSLFLYGMSAHLGMDVFAHSAYYKDVSTGWMLEIKHSENGQGADNTKYIPNRWKAAKELAFWCALNASTEIIGDVQDFSSYGESFWKGFYIYNIVNYAQSADNGEIYTTKEIKELFQDIDYTP